jgi:hypothetical protein
VDVGDRINKPRRREMVQRKEKNVTTLNKFRKKAAKGRMKVMLEEDTCCQTECLV